MTRAMYVPDQDRDTWTGQYGPIHVHGIYPWSVLDTTSALWRARRTHWDTVLGDDAQTTTATTLYAHGQSGYHTSVNRGRSRFDPVLAELMLTWYAPPAARVYDPCAGAATRGLVAAHLGHTYTGVDLSPAQVDANRACDQAGLPGAASWQVGDGARHTPASGSIDMILTCPPYHTVERYSDDPADLSAMSWDAHLDAVAQVAARCHDALTPDRYLVWVVGDLRAPRGGLRLLPHRTALALEGAGFTVVNEHILVNAVGTRHRMLRRWWSPTRSAGRLHQHILVAVKGDRRRAADTVRREPHC